MSRAALFAVRLGWILSVSGWCAAHSPAAVLDEPAGGGAGGGIPRGAKNLFLKAKCTADKVWSRQTPDRAVNGRLSAGDHWAGPPIPARHTVDLGRPATFNTVRMITYFNGGRYYQYHVEASPDGRKWTRIIDQSRNTTAARAAGRVFSFEPLAARYVRTTFTKHLLKGKTPRAYHARPRRSLNSLYPVNYHTAAGCGRRGAGPWGTKPMAASRTRSIRTSSNMPTARLVSSPNCSGMTEPNGVICFQIGP